MDGAGERVARCARLGSRQTPDPNRWLQWKGAVHEGTKIHDRDSRFGTILFDDRGQAIYLFKRKTSRRSRLL